MNSKATLRVHTKDLFHLVPKILHPEVEASRYYAENSQSLVIQGDGSRNRTDNTQECYRKLHALIVAAGRNIVRGETSPEQAEKVKGLYVTASCVTRAELTLLRCSQRKEKEMRLRSKKLHGNKKASRKGFSRGPSY